MVRGVYAQLKAWSDPMHRCGEYAGDNIMIRGASTDAFFEFITFNRTPNNYRLQSFWDNSYKAIAQASNTIKLYEASTDAAVKARVGECYFVRGLLYYYLVRAYGRPYYQDPEKNLGVPLVNGTPDNVFGKFTLPDRATVAESYKQIIADLTKAEELLPVSEGDPSYASKGAAQAILSRVYLYMSGTWEQPNAQYAQLAVDYATKVIATPGSSRSPTRSPSSSSVASHPSTRATITTTASGGCMPISAAWAGVRCTPVPSTSRCSTRRGATTTAPTSTVAS